MLFFLTFDVASKVDGCTDALCLRSYGTHVVQRGIEWWVRARLSPPSSTVTVWPCASVQMHLISRLVFIAGMRLRDRKSVV